MKGTDGQGEKASESGSLGLDKWERSVEWDGGLEPGVLNFGFSIMELIRDWGKWIGGGGRWFGAWLEHNPLF